MAWPSVTPRRTPIRTTVRSFLGWRLGLDLDFDGLRDIGLNFARDRARLRVGLQLEADQPIVGVFERDDQRVELGVHGRRVARLRVVEHEDHQKRSDVLLYTSPPIPAGATAVARQFSVYVAGNGARQTPSNVLLFALPTVALTQ